MFALISVGGKQVLAEEGKWFQTELLPGAVGDAIAFDALLVSDEEGTATKVGMPTVAGAKVSGKILEHGRSEKVSVIKYKRKVRYRRNVGHRQPFTKVLVESITA
jgi:large subunit ribosomal protein L21